MDFITTIFSEETKTRGDQLAVGFFFIALDSTMTWLFRGKTS